MLLIFLLIVVLAQQAKPNGILILIFGLIDYTGIYFIFEALK